MARFLCRIGVHRWLKRNPEVPGFGPEDSTHHTRSGRETYYECERCHKETKVRPIGGFGIGGIGIGDGSGGVGGGGDGGGFDGGGGGWGDGGGGNGGNGGNGG